MYSRILLLSMGLFVPFIVSRIVDSTLFLATGFSSTSLIDPGSLGVRELKLILAIRGVSYVGVLEKPELINLVLSSGQLRAGELTEAKDEHSSSRSAINFISWNHFYEEVEDAKDSVWLIQVVPTRSRVPLLDDLNWKQVRDELQPFGIRAGIFRCQFDPKLCEIKNWLQKPQLVLIMPQGAHPKDSVAYSSSSKPSLVVHWVRNKLNSRLKRIESSSEFEKTWLRFDKGSRLSTEVRIVLLLPNLMEPPLLFSSLSAQFNGRITFGVLNISNADPIFRELPHLENCSSASYVIITPEGIFEYGKRAGEHLNLKRMELTLRTLQPEMGDVLMWSLTIVNFFVLFDAIFIYDEVWKHVVRCFWSIVKNNLILFIFWLSIFGLISKFSPVTSISNVLLKLVRQFSVYDIWSVARNDFVFWKSHPWLIIGMFIFMSLGHNWVRKRRSPAVTIPTRIENNDLIREISIRMSAQGSSPDEILEIARSAWTLVERVNKLPVRRHCSATERDQNDTPVCAICLQDYLNNEIICELPCEHNYHELCIKKWILQDPHQCPICREPITGDYF